MRHQTALIAATLALALLSVWGGRLVAGAATNTPATAAPAGPNPLEADVMAIIDRINANIEQGKMAEADYAPEIRDFETISARHPEATTNDLVFIAGKEAEVYNSILHNPLRAQDVLKRTLQTYPVSTFTTQLRHNIQALEPAAQIIRNGESLTNGAVMPDFSVQDVTGRTVSLAALKGKLVLLDIWATWCPPCRAEIPDIADAYRKFHDQGFEIVGFSQDHKLADLTNFLADQKIPWPQYFDSNSTLSEKYGAYQYPTTYLIDRNGRIIGRNLYGQEIGDAVAAALKK